MLSKTERYPFVAPLETVTLEKCRMSKEKMRAAILVVCILIVGCVQAVANEESDALKNLDNYSRSLKQLNLPKQTYERLLKQGREQILKNYYLRKKIEERK